MSFCSFDADHKLDQKNTLKTGSGGLNGLTLKPAAFAKYFLFAQEMAVWQNNFKKLLFFTMHYLILIIKKNKK